MSAHVDSMCIRSIDRVCSGDSYSSVGYDRTCLHPTREEPLGVEFPGITYAGRRGGPDQYANWVGHFVCSRNTNTKSRNAHLLVYDYAVGGSTVSGVRAQIQRDFIPSVGMKPKWAPWKETNSLFGLA